MPKIIINEQDYTAANVATTNFSVVVPGYCGKSVIAKGIFDSNNVYICSNQDDFVNNVGKVAPTIKQEVKFAEAEVINETATGIDKYYKTILTNKDLVEASNLGKLYTVETLTPYTEGKGKNILHIGESYYKLTAQEINDITPGADVKVVIVKVGNEGSDAENNPVTQMGNQIAYELLGLGYTVLFLNLGKDDTGKELDLTEAVLNPLKDKSVYSFRYIVTGKLNNNKAENELIASVANDRKDCIALCDVDSNKQASIDNIKAETKNCVLNKFSAMFAPTICYSLPKDDIYTNSVFPASFHYLACAAKAQDNGFAEWFAVAGYTRGVSDYTIDSADVKYGEEAINALEPRTNADSDINYAINLITTVRNNTYLWGNRTAATLEDELKASHFLNIRQLCSTLHQEIYTACRRFTFDPNSDTLWINFVNAIKPTLEKMKANQGIRDYKIIQVKSTVKATLKAKVRIVPIEAVEDFDITISLEDSLGEATVTE